MIFRFRATSRNKIYIGICALILLSACGGSSDPVTGDTDSVVSDTDSSTAGSDSTDGSVSEVGDSDTNATGTGSSIEMLDDPLDDNEENNNLFDDDVTCTPVDNRITYAVRANNGSTPRGLFAQGAEHGFGFDGENFCDIDNSTGVREISTLIPWTATPPMVDGVFDTVNTNEWESAVFASSINRTVVENLTRNLLSQNVTGYMDGSRAGDWGAVHDGEYLYILFLARNEHSSSGNQQTWADSVDPRDDDSIELFIDANNSKNSQYDGIDDFHSILPFIVDNPIPVSGPSTASGLSVVYGVSTDDATSFSSLRYEAKIDLASAGIIVGRPFGFDIQLNDDDNGGAGDAKFGWFEQTGSAVADTDPSVLGTVLLTGCRDDSACGVDQLLDPNNPVDQN